VQWGTGKIVAVGLLVLAVIVALIVVLSMVTSPQLNAADRANVLPRPLCGPCWINSLAIFVFRGERLVYSNPPATRLIHRLRTNTASSCWSCCSTIWRSSGTALSRWEP
jgi:hypothetical protein